MPAFNDTFTDTDGTVLTSHTSDSGHTWARHPSASGDEGIDSNRLHHTGSVTGTSYAGWAPGSADHWAEAAYIRKTSLGQNGPCVRIQTGNMTLYWVRYNTGNGKFELCSIVAGTLTILSSVTFTLTVDQSYALRLTANGSTLTVDVDGVNQITITNTDVTANGRIGVRAATTTSSTTGFHIDALTADVVSAGGGGSVSASVSTATAGSQAAAVTGGASALAGGATATAQSYAATVTGGSSGGASVAASCAIATAGSAACAALGGAVVGASVGTAAAASWPASVSAPGGSLIATGRSAVPDGFGRTALLDGPRRTAYGDAVPRGGGRA